MPRLTVPPNFIGTSGIDTLVAQESNTSVAIGIDILNPNVISTFSGNDTITGTGTGGTGGVGIVTGVTNSIPPGIIRGESGEGGAGIGISNSNKLNTGKGEDTLIGTGTAGRNNKTGRESSTGGTTIGIQNIKTIRNSQFAITFCNGDLDPATKLAAC